MRLTPDIVMQACEDSCENANEHDMRPTTYWLAIKPYIARKDQLSAAKALATEIASDWECFVPDELTD